MSEAIEKNSKISSAYDESAYLDHERLQSVDPSQTSSPEPISSQADAPDQYAASEDKQALTLDTVVTVSGPHGQQNLSLRQALVEAGQGNQPAKHALEKIIREHLATQADREELNQCFAGCEANAADILAQLESGDATQRREAAKSILSLILGREVLRSDPELRALQKGLLVATALIDSREYYDEIKNLDEASLRQFQQLVRETPNIPETPKLLRAVAENPHFRSHDHENSTNPENQTAVEGGAPALSADAALIAQGASGQAAGIVTVSSAPAVSPATVIAQILQGYTSRYPVAGEFLSASGSRVLNARLAEIAGNAALTPAQQAQGLRLAILATAFRQPDFNSTEKHFGPLRSVATVMANDILRSLGASHAESAATTALRQGRHDRSLSARDSSLESAASPAQESIAATFPMAGRTANRSAATTGFFAMPSYAASDPAALPLSTLAAAGIQGISPAVLALGAGALALGGNDSHRPSYYVEETTAADSDTHSGSQQDSSRQGQEERPSQEQATAYLA